MVLPLRVDDKLSDADIETLASAAKQIEKLNQQLTAHAARQSARFDQILQKLEALSGSVESKNPRGQPRSRHPESSEKLEVKKSSPTDVTVDDVHRDSEDVEDALLVAHNEDLQDVMVSGTVAAFDWKKVPAKVSILNQSSDLKLCEFDYGIGKGREYCGVGALIWSLRTSIILCTQTVCENVSKSIGVIELFEYVYLDAWMSFSCPKIMLVLSPPKPPDKVAAVGVWAWFLLSLQHPQVSFQIKSIEETETFASQTEIRQLLTFIINTFYSNKEIFLHDLDSNSSFALDKIIYESLMEKRKLKLFIKMRPDKVKKTLSIVDRMTKADLFMIKDFKKAVQTRAYKSIIGQLDVGSFSAHLMAVKIVVTTKYNDDVLYVWESESQENQLEYPKDMGLNGSINKHSKIARYQISLWAETKKKKKIKELSLSHEWSLVNKQKLIWMRKIEGITNEGCVAFYKSLIIEWEELVGKHFSVEGQLEFKAILFVLKRVHFYLFDSKKKPNNFKIYTPNVFPMDNLEGLIPKYLNFVKDSVDSAVCISRELMHQNQFFKCCIELLPELGESKDEEGKKPIWMRTFKETTKEYVAFYKSLSNGGEEHLAVKCFNVKEQLEFKALLFVPKRATSDLFDTMNKLAEMLRVFIMGKYEKLTPEYLSFVKGWVDFEDQPLNMSREMLHKNMIFKVIRKNLVRTYIELFREIAESKEDYIKFYKTFSKNLQLCILEDLQNKSKLADLLMYHSTKNTDQMTSMNDYAARMNEGQNDVYCSTGESKNVVDNSPFLNEGYEVHYIVEYVVGQLQFEGKKLVSATKEFLVFSSPRPPDLRYSIFKP